MLDPLLLGIDIGTSSTKAVLISQGGECIGYTQQTYGIDSPYPGWAEQHPQVWWDAVLATTQQLIRTAEVHPKQIIGIGLSGQMHGTVCVGEDGEALRSAVIWADQRSEQQIKHIYRQVGKVRMAEWTGNPLATGFMLPTWLWLRENEPDILRKTRWLMLPKDYIRLKLTGQPGSEPSDAASTSLFNPAIHNWSTPLIDALELDMDVLPPVSPSTEVAGYLLSPIAKQIGLCAGTPVIYGGSDQAMQALGNGVIQPGILSSTIGTGGQLFTTTEEYVVDDALRMHSFCHVLPNRWHLETAILSAGLSLKWLRDNVLKNNVLKNGSYQELADAASSIPVGADGVIFVPYLLGERTPHMDPNARGCLVGLTKFHNRNHIIRAVMEGVVYAMKQGLELMLDLGVQVEKVVASGGAVAHPLWLQLQSNIYSRPVYRSKTIEAAACGAAILAGVGVGLYDDAEQAVNMAVHWYDTAVQPEPAKVLEYAQRYRQFSALYPNLKSVNHSLAKADFMW